MLEDMGYVRQLNEGVSRIYESMEKSMLSVPEYQEKNGNISLILRNKISNHSKTIDNLVMQKLEKNWLLYNETQKKVLHYLFLTYKATLNDIVAYVGINENTVRSYLNKFIEEDLLDKKSTKLRDLNAVYTFKKH